MSNSIQPCVFPGFYNKPEKSNTGKKLGLLAGVGTTAYGLVEGDTFKSYTSEVSSALDSYRFSSKGKELKKLMPKKEFVKNYIKMNRIERAGQAAAVGALCVTAGLAAGLLVDKAIDAVKNHKAKKAQKEFEAKYM